MNTNKHELGGPSKQRRLTTRDERTDVLLYTAPDGQVKVTCILHDETIFDDGELQREATGSILETVQGSPQVKRTVEFYNLDAIISVGYRLNSFKATRFCIWATPLLKAYISKPQAKTEATMDKNTRVHPWFTIFRGIQCGLWVHSLTMVSEGLSYD